MVPSFQRPSFKSLQVFGERANLRQTGVVRGGDYAAIPLLVLTLSAVNGRTHGVGMAAFVANPDLRSPGITVGAT